MNWTIWLELQSFWCARQVELSWSLTVADFLAILALSCEEKYNAVVCDRESERQVTVAEKLAEVLLALLLCTQLVQSTATSYCRDRAVCVLASF
jgi:hypothetical protein